MAPRQLQQASSTLDRPQPFQIRGSNLTLLTLKLTDPYDPAFLSRLESSLAIAPGFYRHAPIILDLAEVVDLPAIDLGAFCARLRELALVPVGFVGATAEWEQAALAAGLSVCPAGRATDPSSTRGRGAPSQRRRTARVVSDPVRSGQQVYAAQSDLVVLAPVSRGAELMADGNIHAYGRLRGRALAGTSGDTTARIFCRAFDADLVSIAGVYLVSEQMDAKLIGTSVQIRLDGERLVFEPL
jgi:septum site-determining protein MinC